MPGGHKLKVCKNIIFFQTISLTVQFQIYFQETKNAVAKIQQRITLFAKNYYSYNPWALASLITALIPFLSIVLSIDVDTFNLIHFFFSGI